MVCACGNTMNAGAVFCSRCGRPAMVGGEQRRLERPRVGRKIAGVCAGIAAYTGWDLTLVRVVAVVAVFLGVGMPLLAYVVGWIVMPEAPLVNMPPVVMQPPAVYPPTPAGGPDATL